MSNKKGILLESGTNELEIIEFKIGDNHFGMNIAKVVEIIPYTEVTHLPNANPYIKGIFKPREKVITVIDLPKYLNIETENENETFFIISHLNKIIVAFHVHSVLGIHRVSWEEIQKPDDTIHGGKDSIATGIVNIKDKLIIMLDFEKILLDISPSVGIKLSEITEKTYDVRRKKPILIAEDSETLTKMLIEALHKAGYSNIITTQNGKEAWDILKNIRESEKDEILDKIACVITDIEMPQMDGHHLTKLIKDDRKLSTIPVVVFSSIISDSMKNKGEAIGVDAHVTKPEIGNLVEVLDNLILVASGDGS